MANTCTCTDTFSFSQKKQVKPKTWINVQPQDVSHQNIFILFLHTEYHTVILTVETFILPTYLYNLTVHRAIPRKNFSAFLWNIHVHASNDWSYSVIRCSKWPETLSQKVQFQRWINVKQTSSKICVFPVSSYLIFQWNLKHLSKINRILIVRLNA